MEDIRGDNWRNVDEDDWDRKKNHALGWEVETIDKEQLIKREFLVSVMHPKRGNIVWNCVKYNIIKEKYQYNAIGLHGFEYKLFQEEESGWGGGSRGIIWV